MEKPIFEIAAEQDARFLSFDICASDDLLDLCAEFPESGEGMGAKVTINHRLNDLKHVWIPHLTPYPGYVIGDHAFRSPAIVLANEYAAGALVPDLDDLAVMQRSGLRDESKGVRVWMDYEHPKSTISIAVGNYQLSEHHVSYKVAAVGYCSQKPRLRVHIIHSNDPEDLANPYGMVARFLWDRWGRAIYTRGGSQNATFQDYAKHITHWAFTPEPEGWSDTVWQEFEIDGKKVGAPTFIADVQQHPSVAMDERRWREPRSVWNQAWFATQRCANGLMRYALQIGSEDLEQRARLMTEFAMSAPLNDGLFPSIYTTGGGLYELYKDSSSWKDGYWTNSGRKPRDVSEQACHILDASFTCRNLLEWMDITGEDARIRDYVLNYVERLVTLQLGSGAFPGWVEPDGTVPGTLAEGPETAMSASLLLQLAVRYPDDPNVGRWRLAAISALDYLTNDPISASRWEDFETYFSCSGWGEPGKMVERNGVYKQNNLSIFWCAEAMLEAYRALGDERYLSIGRRCLDELSLYQQVWNPPYILADCHGGFGVMNFDGEWNDARQSLFAPLYLEYYKDTGNAEYFERGVSALRASFAMLYCPENAAVAKEYERRHPMFGPESYGFMMENIYHEGWGGEPIGVFTIFTWGNGAALSAAAKVRDSYGDVYVDTQRSAAFGIDGCSTSVNGSEVTIQDSYGRDVVAVVFSDGVRRDIGLTRGRATVGLKQ